MSPSPVRPGQIRFWPDFSPEDLFMVIGPCGPVVGPDLWTIRYSDGFDAWYLISDLEARTLEFESPMQPAQAVV
jgi:hypothetical protein